MDSDFSHDPAYLPRLLDAARTRRPGDRLALRRRRRGQRLGRGAAAISRGGSVYSRLVLGVEVHDLTGGFKCFRREVLEAIDLDSIEVRGYAFQVEMTYRAIQLGFSVVEVPIVFRDRRAGESKMDGAIVAEAIFQLPRLRFGSHHVRAGRATARRADRRRGLSRRARSTCRRGTG